MGAGIAKDFEHRFKLKKDLNKINRHVYPDCIRIGKVFNLVTKDKYFNKPIYETLTKALLCMKKIIIEKDIKYIAMPLIGCGIDKLNWNKVEKIIKTAFNDIDITIFVCKIQEISRLEFYPNHCIPEYL